MKKGTSSIESGILTDAARMARFDRLCDQAIRERHVMGEAGIGTMQEKRMHAVIKRFLCEDASFHEVGLADTRYVSDVRIGDLAYEVQTGAFYPMRRKIDHYLEATDCTVTVVHPIPRIKWSCHIDATTHEVTPRRKVAGGRPLDVLPELYCLLPHLGNPRLRVHLLLLEVQDFRLTDFARKGRRGSSRRYERVPLSLVGEMELYSPEDFRVFLPEDLPQPFTVKQFSEQTKLRGRDAYSAVRVLAALGLLAPADPIGRSMAFRVVEK
ncbi:MAG: hypothetical protein IJX62_03930 [Clostridia bacterium]|nr:hypothetical protein [Clostridia bacterium]